MKEMEGFPTRIYIAAITQPRGNFRNAPCTSISSLFHVSFKLPKLFKLHSPYLNLTPPPRNQSAGAMGDANRAIHNH
jgi:hypothetical protein